MNRVTPEEVKKLASNAAQVTGLALSLGTHQEAMDALLSAYCAIASAHPCCVELYGRLLGKAGEQVLAFAAQNIGTHQVH